MKIRANLRQILNLALEDKISNFSNIYRLYTEKERLTRSQKKRFRDLDLQERNLWGLFIQSITYCNRCKSYDKDMYYFPKLDEWNCKECTLKSPIICEEGFKKRRKSKYLNIIDYDKLNVSELPLYEFDKKHLKIIPEKVPLPFSVNEYLLLKYDVEDNETVIYVNNERFRTCKYLLLNIPIKEFKKLDEIESIDEAEIKLDKSMESQEILIYPDVEFWGHCSNLQVWYENDYDTRLLHRNLAFPLLKKLTDVGDPLAKTVFKEEIAKRYKSGFPSVVKYLEEEGYLEYLSKEELEALK